MTVVGISQWTDLLVVDDSTGRWYDGIIHKALISMGKFIENIDRKEVCH